MTSVAREATYADLEALPDGMIGQIIDGELIAMPRPALRHARSATVLGIQLGSALDGIGPAPRGWLFLYEPELHLGRDVVVPDLAGWRRERLPELPDAPFLDVAPDWVCEVLSPSSVSIDRVRKVRVYGRERVGWYWILDPIARTLEVLRLQADGVYALDASFDAEDVVRARPFDTVELSPWR